MKVTPIGEWQTSDGQVPPEEVDVPIIASRQLPTSRLPIATVSLFDVANAVVRGLGVSARRTIEWTLSDGSTLVLTARHRRRHNGYSEKRRDRWAPR